MLLGSGTNSLRLCVFALKNHWPAADWRSRRKRRYGIAERSEMGVCQASVPGTDFSASKSEIGVCENRCLTPIF